MNAPRTILYTRVSTVAQDDNNSHESQLAALQKHVAARGGLIVRVIRETASGGSYLGRPGIQQAIAALEADEADALLCFDFSRYSRDEEHQQAMMKRVERAGKRIEFSNLELSRDEEGALTPESRLMMSMNGGFAAYHKAKIRADTMRGAKASAEKGIQPRRKPPFGYHIATTADVLAGRHAPGDLGRYFIVESEAPLVREIFERRAQGESFSSLCRWLYASGARTRRGALWVDSSLSKLLSNPVYKGTALYGETRRIVDETRFERGFAGAVTYQKRAPGDVVKIPAPPIVPASTWDLVNALKPEKGALSDKRSRFLLSRVLRCPRCGGPMSGKTQQNSSTGPKGRPRKGEVMAPITRSPWRFYVCHPREWERLGGKRCLGRCYPAATLDGLVLGAIAQLLDGILPEVTSPREAVREAGREAAVSPQRQEMTREIETLTARERTLIEAQLRAMEQGIASETYETLLRETAGQKKRVQARLETLDALARRGHNPRSPLEVRAQLEILHALASDPAALTPLSPQLQRIHNLFVALFERIDFEEPERGVIDNLKLTFR